METFSLILLLASCVLWCMLGHGFARALVLPFLRRALRDYFAAWDARHGTTTAPLPPMAVGPWLASLTGTVLLALCAWHIYTPQEFAAQAVAFAAGALYLCSQALNDACLLLKMWRGLRRD